MVCMLSVYYILMPNDNEVDVPVSNIDGETRYQEFAKMRLEIIAERNEEVLLYETKIVDQSVSIDDVSKYVIEIETIQKTTEREVYIEGIIINLGYEDCLVYLDEFNKLHISVLAKKFEIKDYFL